jgi:glycosidase
LGRTLKRVATLDDIPDSTLDEWQAGGFDWIWMLSVWQTGAAAQAVSRANPGWLHEFGETLPDLTEDDIAGSGFAIREYTVHEGLGGEVALVRLRHRLAARGLKLMLDFVPNHMAPDHPWVASHPDYFIRGSEDDLANAPQNYFRVGGSVFAHGRDPFFDGWPDTVQLNYANPVLQQAMIGELERIARQCDGVRCDMAMLVSPDVFANTWGLQAELFWPRAIEAVRAAVPGFLFMAEVYWDREWQMQQQGFDYTYDKTLYDRLHAGHARPVREYFHAELDYQAHMARFLENHDEPRVATAFGYGMHIAAAALTYLSPGLRFFHQGQFTGRRKRISPHLVRAPEEPVDELIEQFYERLLAVLRYPVVREGQWQLLECGSAWEHNWTSDYFVAFAWRGPTDELLLVTVNYSPNQGQCYVQLPFAELAGGAWRLHDLVGEAVYDRDGDDLLARGLYLNEGPWSAQVFAVTRGE